MAKKKNNQTLYILGAIAIAVFIYGGQAGWFQSAYNIMNYPSATPEQVIILENPPTTTETCTLSITPLEILLGESVTGIIQNGPNTFCEVYATDGSGWRLIFDGTTDSTGRTSSTQSIDFPGIFQLRAICGSCSTNEVTLIVNLLPEDEPEPEDPFCIDSDDSIDIYTGGYVTNPVDNYYDYCIDSISIREYFCTGGITVTSVERDCGVGYFCMDSTGGDYCVVDVGPEPEPAVDTDGDGYSDEEEDAAGTNPLDPNSYPDGPAETSADYCNALGFPVSNYMPGSSLNACRGWAFEFCPVAYSVPFADGEGDYHYSDPSCCIKCI